MRSSGREEEVGMTATFCKRLGCSRGPCQIHKSVGFSASPPSNDTAIQERAELGKGPIRIIRGMIKTHSPFLFIFDLCTITSRGQQILRGTAASSIDTASCRSLPCGMSQRRVWRRKYPTLEMAHDHPSNL